MTTPCSFTKTSRGPLPCSNSGKKLISNGSNLESSVFVLCSINANLLPIQSRLGFMWKGGSVHPAFYRRFRRGCPVCSYSHSHALVDVVAGSLLYSRSVA